MNSSLYLGPLRGNAAPAVLVVRTYTSDFSGAVCRSALLIPGQDGAVLTKFDWKEQRARVPGGGEPYGEVDMERLAVKAAVIELHERLATKAWLPTEFRLSPPLEVQDWLIVGHYRAEALGKALTFFLEAPADDYQQDSLVNVLSTGCRKALKLKLIDTEA